MLPFLSSANILRPLITLAISFCLGRVVIFNALIAIEFISIPYLHNSEAQMKVSAFVLLYKKDPVSVKIPRYKAVAISWSISIFKAWINLYTNWQVAAELGST